LSVDFDRASIPVAAWRAFERLAPDQLTALHISRRRWSDDGMDAVAAPGLADGALKCLLTHLPRLRNLSILLRTQLSPAALQLVGRTCREMEMLSLDGTFDIYDVDTTMRTLPPSECEWAKSTDKGDATDIAGSRHGNLPLFPNLVHLFITTAEQPSSQRTARYV
jgi:hypothetical protein